MIVASLTLVRRRSCDELRETAGGSRSPRQGRRLGDEDPGAGVGRALAGRALGDDDAAVGDGAADAGAVGTTSSACGLADGTEDGRHAGGRHAHLRLMAMKTLMRIIAAMTEKIQRIQSMPVVEATPNRPASQAPVDSQEAGCPDRTTGRTSRQADQPTGSDSATQSAIAPPSSGLSPSGLKTSSTRSPNTSAIAKASRSDGS